MEKSQNDGAVYRVTIAYLAKVEAGNGRYPVQGNLNLEKVIKAGSGTRKGPGPKPEEEVSMHDRAAEENHRPELSSKQDITLRTALYLYSEKHRLSRWFLLDLLVLLSMFLLFVHVQSPEGWVLKAPIPHVLRSWFGQMGPGERAIDPFQTGHGLRSSGKRRVLTGKSQLVAEAGPYLGMISDAAAANQVGEELILAVIKVESGFNPGAVSSEGAMGLMQLMPLTARDLGVKDPFDPKENIHGGAAYLSYCLRRFNDVQLALAAYNAGPGLISRLKRVPPYKETVNFVASVLRHRAQYDALL